MTFDGFPLGYEVFAGNTHDSRTLQTIVATMEARHGGWKMCWSNIITWEISPDDPDDPVFVEANDALLRMLGYDREDFVSGRIRRSDVTPPEWRDRDRRTMVEVRATGVLQPFESHGSHCATTAVAAETPEITG